MTKRALAEAVHVSDRSISSYEAGDVAPASETLLALSRVLGFPVSFFERPSFSPLSAENASFRSLARLTAAQRDAAFGAGTIAIALDDWIHERFVLPAPDVPDDLTGVDAETAAATVRAVWGPGQRPIRNLVHLLEKHGVRVYSLAEECAEVDAFSLWQNGVPYVFLNSMKTAERSRFDAAHELGHLVLHRDRREPRGKQEEIEANAFASAFLMPKEDILGRLGGLIDLETILIAKRRWRVSALALVYRLHSLGVLTEWRYRSLCVELRRRFPRTEPNGLPRERSQVLEKVLTSLRSQGKGIFDIANELDLPPSELQALVFNLALTGVEGGGSAGAGRPAHLKLIT